MSFSGKLILGLLLSSTFFARADSRKITYDEDILPVLRNSCLNCHNPDKKKAGLDLSSYSALMAGSDNGKVIKLGDPAGSSLFKTMSHAEEPFMPKNGDKLPDAQLALFKTWIASGAPEAANSKVNATAKKNDLAPVVTRIGKPDSPPPMPLTRLSLEPVIHTERPGAILAMAASPWAPLVALGGQHQIVLYDTRSLDLLGVLPFDAGQINSLRFSADGSLLLAAGGRNAQSGKALLYDIRQGKKIGEVGDEFDAILSADLSPDHSLIAVGTPNKMLKVYSAIDGKVLYTVKKHTDWVTACAFSPDGVLLASGDRAGNVYVWEARTGRDFYTLAGHKDAITAVAFRDDGNILATASQDQMVKLWNMQDGSQVGNHSGHVGGTTCLAFAHDGRVVTCGRDRVVAIWNASIDNNVGTEVFPDVALQCAFSDDGQRVIAGDWSGAVKVFNAADGKKVGEITANPAGPSERLAMAAKNAADLQAQSDRLMIDAANAKAALDKSSKALSKAQQGQGAAQVNQAMLNLANTDGALRKANASMQAAAAALQQKKDEINRLSDEKVQLGIALDNAPQGQRKAAAQKVQQNAQQLKQAQAALVEAQKPIKPRQDEVTQATAAQKEAADELTKALANADSDARQLPQATEAQRNASDALAKARLASDAASMRFAAAKADLERLKASIAGANSATQPSARS